MRISDWSSDVCSSDLQDMPAFLDQLFRLAVHLGYQRAGGVQIIEPARFGCIGYRLRHAVRRKADGAAIRHNGQVLAETRALGQIGRTSCRERLWPYESISGVAVSLKKKQT